MLAWPGQDWQLWHQDGCSRSLLAGIVHLEDGSKPTLFAPVKGQDYRGMINKGDAQAAFQALQEAWDSVTTEVAKNRTAARPSRSSSKTLGEDDLERVYGTKEAMLAVTQPMTKGDVQLTNPFHVHRAPPPPKSKGNPRRTIFVSWDRFRLENASSTVTWHDNWRSVWESFAREREEENQANGNNRKRRKRTIF